MDVLADVRDGKVIDDATQWPVVANLNREVLTRLSNDGAVLSDATEADTQRVINQWTFPLHDLDLREIDVKVKDLQELRERHLAAQYGAG
ncbi:hypothetical protein [Actinoallomurus sp. NPDC050550]|uniref:hypothetical protein n=1 Tax=Actinoallomurus sp. NPDC050550 TaxID=3154937 RepID=UPI00340F8293